MANAPLTDAIAFALSRLIDDSQTDRRDPSHSDIAFVVDQAGLASGDPKSQGRVVGKAKRVRETLTWALESSPAAGEVFVSKFMPVLRVCGSFRDDSPNYVGQDAITNAMEAFRLEGWELSRSGELRPQLLDALSGVDLTKALEAYVRRAQRGVEDAALLAGTGKDLLEATAAHVLTERYGHYSTQSNFPTLLGQAFGTLGLATTADPKKAGEAPQKRLERALYESGCAVNALRNREGTGHGRPWLTNVSDAEARVAIEVMAAICERLLQGLRS